MSNLRARDDSGVWLLVTAVLAADALILGVNFVLLVQAF
jgi:hypothetical protein